MNPEQIAAYIQAGSLLLAAGGALVSDVKAMFGAAPAMTEDALNEILAGIEADAERRRALAQGDAGEAPGASATGGSSQG